jgi:murein DD-endopeptidase MepM/ murein hydrolase activator NlpD
MIRRLLPAAPPLLALAAALAGPVAAATPASADEVVRRVGRVTIHADLEHAFPGGVVVVRLSGARLGSAWALLDGRRAPFYPSRGGPRALVPVAASTEPGEATLGVGIAARRGEQRIAVPVRIGEHAYASKSVYLDAPKRSLLARPEVLRDARRLLGYLRSESSGTVPGTLVAPVAASGRGFGELRTHTGSADAESRTDALGGERHRGLDYAVPVGTPIRAPGAGTVVFSGPLALTGETVVIDHGQGVVSVLQHLSRVQVKAGDAVAAGAELGASGDTGLAPEPLVQWRVYLHAVPVDPRVLALVLGG